MNLNNNIIKEKLEYFLKNKKKVHIIKKNKRFINGYVIKKLSDEVFIIRDDADRELDIFIFEILDIVNYSIKGCEAQ